MQKQSLTNSDKRSVIVYEFTLRDALTASAVLSGPMATIVSSTYAYNYGFSLPASIMCGVGTAISYGVIIKALLCPTKKINMRKTIDL